MRKPPSFENAFLNEKKSERKSAEKALAQAKEANKTRIYPLRINAQTTIFVDSQKKCTRKYAKWYEENILNNKK